MTIEEAKSFHDEMNIMTHAHSLRDGGKILKKQQLKEISTWNTHLISCGVQA